MINIQIADIEKLILREQKKWFNEKVLMLEEYKGNHFNHEQYRKLREARRANNSVGI